MTSIEVTKEDHKTFLTIDNSSSFKLGSKLGYAHFNQLILHLLNSECHVLSVLPISLRSLLNFGIVIREGLDK